MARKDWLTGQSLEREGPNPIAGFLSGLMQAQAGKQQQADEDRRLQQEQAMTQIKEGRTMLEKAAQLDPTLWGDTGFMGAWQGGQVDYLAKNGWKPKTPEETKTLKEQFDEQVSQWYAQDPTGKTWPDALKGYATKSMGLFSASTEDEGKISLIDWGTGKRVARTTSKGLEIQDEKGQWVPFTGITPGKPSGGGGGGGGGGKDPEEIKRTDMDAVERWLFSGSYDPMKNIFTPGWLKVMGDQKKDWNTVKKGILSRYRSTPWLANYAIQRAQGDPTSPFYTDDTVPPPPPPPGQIDKAKLDKMASDAVGKHGTQGALKQIGTSKLSPEEKAYLTAKIQGLQKPKVTVPKLPNVHL